MERIENPNKYKQKESFKNRLTSFLRWNFFWLPILLLFISLVVAILVFRQQNKSKPSLGVNYNSTVSRDDYTKKKTKSLLDQFEDKIFTAKQLERKNRYQHIISGKDVVSVDFGYPVREDTKSNNEIADSQNKLSSENDSQDLEQQQLKQEKEKPGQLHHPINGKITGSYANSKKVARYKKINQAKQQAIPHEHASKNLNDSLAFDPEASRLDTLQNPFASLKLTANKGDHYVLAYIHGDQIIGSGSLIKLRLGESLTLEDHFIDEGTVFTGKVSMNSNAIQVQVNRIDRYSVNYQIFDQDYSRGIVMDYGKNQDLEQALSRSAYQTGNRSLMDLPYTVLQDVARSVMQQKRKNQQMLQLNDGHVIYLAKQ